MSFIANIFTVPVEKYRSIKRTICIVALLLFISITHDVLSQTVRGGNIDTLRPNSSVNSVWQLTMPGVKRHKKWTAGVLANWAYKPVKLYVAPVGQSSYTEYPVYQRTQVDLSFAIGIKKWLELGIVVPVIAYQSGDFDIQAAGIGDPRLQGKVLFYKTNTLNMAAGLDVTIPVGHYAYSGTDFMGYAGPSVLPKFIVGYTARQLHFVANGGMLFRPVAHEAAYDQLINLVLSAGIIWDVTDFEEVNGIRLGVETNAEIGLGMDDLAQLPWEVLASFKFRTRRDIVLATGAGLGLTDAMGTPLIRAIAGIYFDTVLHACAAGPEDYDGFQDDDKCIDPDNDGDGVPDEQDQCPFIAEDMDSFKDEDGCPDHDNDGDGVPDVMDSCPMLEEDLDDFEDEDGCPEEGPGRATVEITDSQLLLSSKIYFDYDKSSIKEVSHQILDKVAETLNDNKDIVRVVVEGHSDNAGTEDYNTELSRLRAKSVVDYLVKQGVDENRLEYEGLGFAVPKASNDSEEGRAINRRVEFKIFRE